MLHSVTQWLDATAAKYPDKIALVDEHRSYTFAQFRQMALSIAGRIIRDFPDRKMPIVVYMEKSANMLVTYLGIAYSGNYYSPIATDMPDSRVEKILETLQPKALICDEADMDHCAPDGELHFSGKRYAFQEITKDTGVEDEVLAVSSQVIASDLLYVLFTSGSTGTPKGVGIAHHNVINYIDWVAETFGITEKDAFGNQAPFYFDNSVFDIYSCVRNGSTLYIIPGTLFMQPVKLLQYLVDNHITTIFWVPSALMMVSKLRALNDVDLSGTIKRVLFAGEVMPSRHLNIWRKALPEDVVYANLYGPTESDVCTAYIVDREFSDDEAIPIGKAIPNMEIILLGEDDKPVKGEENGELCIRGSIISVGYYNNPEKTAEAFVQNPLNTAYKEVIYRTGDIVHYNDRGEIVYVCRKDFQIKHLGHRIELGEIETAVSSLAGVDNCCCTYDEKKSRIVLFIESKDESMDQKSVNAQVAGMVPDYMVPGKVIRLDQFPYNLNGKLDRIKLRSMFIK